MTKRCTRFAHDATRRSPQRVAFSVCDDDQKTHLLHAISYTSTHTTSTARPRPARRHALRPTQYVGTTDQAFYAA